jgi:hypothetical protein
MNVKPRLTRTLSLAVAAGALALAGPIAGAGAYTMPAASALSTSSTLPITSTLPVYSLPTAGLTGLGGLGGLGANAVGGNQIGQAGCVGTNRPSVGGNNGSTSAQSCGAVLNFSGPQIGQIASVIGPTIIGSPNSYVVVSAGPVTG